MKAGRHAARRLLAAFLATGAAGAVAAATPLAPPAPGTVGDWNFQVTLDGKPIGEHRFTVRGQGAERTVHSVAKFEVKFFGVTVYTYAHEARERWRDGCLVSLQAETDDDRKLAKVAAERAGSSTQAPLKVTRSGDEVESLAGCVMTFAYWNPAMQTQNHLLNPQTGRYEAVQVSVGESGTVEVRGQQVPARQVRITGPKDAIELWYSPEGDWLALDSRVGQRSLSYRLK